jgi:hypothetical protein
VTIPTTAHVWDALAGRTVYGPLFGRAQDLAGQAHAFHWPLEFPDVMTARGFDVVLGNPPWERIKLQEQEFFAAREPAIAEAPNAAARGRMIATLKAADPGTRERALYDEFETTKRIAEASSVLARVPEEDRGRFPLTGRGDVNTYALFAELFANLTGPRGRAGVIVPTGIATDITTSAFFANIIDINRLVRLISFENEEFIFPTVHHSFRFCLLTLKAPGGDQASEFSFFLRGVDDLQDSDRCFALRAADIARINPNTKTAPIFRSRHDAELTARIYSRVPVLLNNGSRVGGNPWDFTVHTRIWHMAEDAAWFRNASQLHNSGYVRSGSDWVKPEPRSGEALLDSRGASTYIRYVALYEAKMMHQFDHRWATYDASLSRDTILEEKVDPAFEVTPRYWVPADEVENRLSAKGWKHKWLMAWRETTSAHVLRTMISTVLPRVAIGHKAPLFFSDHSPGTAAVLLANFNSLMLDYVARQKVGGTSMAYFYLKQFPILPPNIYSNADFAFVVPRVLELVYTSWSLKPFALDLGFDGPPFAWSEERRGVIRAELDAWYARAYGLSRDDLRYILDPADVRGPDYPSETFRVLKKNEIARYGEYRTARLVLAAWDAQEARSAAAQ